LANILPAAAAGADPVPVAAQSIFATVGKLSRDLADVLWMTPDKQEKATQTVLEQAELLCQEEGL
jgi:hypothetical protein